MGRKIRTEDREAGQYAYPSYQPTDRTTRGFRDRVTDRAGG